MVLTHSHGTFCAHAATTAGKGPGKSGKLKRQWALSLIWATRLHARPMGVHRTCGWQNEIEMTATHKHRTALLVLRCKEGEPEPSPHPQPGDWRVDERKLKKRGVVGFVIALARLHVPYRGPAWGCIARADEQTESN